MLIDSHCHLGFKDLGENTSISEKFLENAKANGLVALLNIATTPKVFDNYINFTSPHLQIFNAIGVHPLHIDEVENYKAEDLEKYIFSLSENKRKSIIAIGETGFDGYYVKDKFTKQREYFNFHSLVATKLKLPLVIHTREAQTQTLDALASYVQSGGVGGVIHCFTGNKDFAKACLDLGFYISFSGITTFKTATDIQETLKYVPLDKILIETDAPFLAPVPHRGKTNEPAFVKHTAEFIANYLGLSYNDFVKQQHANFCRLFNLTLNNLN